MFKIKYYEDMNLTYYDIYLFAVFSMKIHYRLAFLETFQVAHFVANCVHTTF